jgi:hypothetical protein
LICPTGKPRILVAQAHIFKVLAGQKAHDWATVSHYRILEKLGGGRHGQAVSEQTGYVLFGGLANIPVGFFNGLAV